MNTVNMYAMKHSMPMVLASWKQREEEMETEFTESVLLASGFAKVSAVVRHET